MKILKLKRKRHKETELEAIQRRQKTYGCDGQCYSGIQCCNAIDTCDETRHKEFLATILVLVLFILIAIAILIGLIWLIKSICTFFLELILFLLF